LLVLHDDSIRGGGMVINAVQIQPPQQLQQTVQQQ
jgi:hypothetical protein